MVYVLEEQVATVVDDQYCDKANVSIRIDKKMDSYRVYLMIIIDWEGESTTLDFTNAQIQGISMMFVNFVLKSSYQFLTVS